MKTNLMPADTYIVINKTSLNNEDRNQIIMLYQPIIGSVAISLYFTLWSNLDQSQISSVLHTHHNLMVLLRVKLSEIIEAREKLEAIGLIKTYVKKDTVNNYVYELYSPISAYEFFSNPILSTSLANNIGNKEYKKLIEYFRIPKLNLKGYQNISAKFSETFTVTNVIDMNGDIELRKINSLEFQINNAIDINDVFSYLPEELINIKTLTNSSKKIIEQLSFIYNLNAENMAELIRNSINEKHQIDKNTLRINCQNYYQFENKGHLPSLIYKKQPEYLRKEETNISKKAKAIHMFETTSPYDFLTGKNKGTKPNKRDLKLVESLLIDYELKTGVVNVLIDYVLRINDNKLTKNFVEAIATQWKRSNINTVEDAMEISLKEYQNKKTKVIKKAKEIKPSWFNKNIESEKATKEEIEALEERLKAGEL